MRLAGASHTLLFDWFPGSLGRHTVQQALLLESSFRPSEFPVNSASFTRAGPVVRFAVACASESKMAEKDPVVTMAAAYTAAWCSQDPASVAAHYTEDGSLTINDGAPAVGRAAIAESASAFMTSLPDIVVAMDSVQVEGRSAFYHWTLTGTNTGPGGSGKAVRISGHEEWTLSPAHLIQCSLGHYDAVEYDRQIREGADSRP